MTFDIEPQRERKRQSTGAKVLAFGIVGLAILAIIETVVLITLAVTGQI